MKESKEKILWVLTIFLALSAFTFIPGISSSLFALLACAAAPVTQIQEVINKIITKKWLKNVIIVIIALAAIYTAPTNNTYNQQKNSIEPQATDTIAIVQSSQKPEPTEKPTPEPTEKPTPKPTATPTLAPTPTPTEKPTPTPKITPAPTIEPTPKPTPKPAQASSAQKQNTQNNEAAQTPTSAECYTTPTGKRYHFSAACAGKNATPSTIAKATSSGLTPCKKCAQ